LDCEAKTRPKGAPGAFPGERPVHAGKRPFAKQRLKVKPSDSGHSRVANADPDEVEGERLHLAVAKWRCRPKPVAGHQQIEARKQTYVVRIQGQFLRIGQQP
jgi:hypothetical protein